MGTIKRTFANNLTGAGKLDATALDSNLPAANIANSSVTNVSSLPSSLGQAIASVAGNPPSQSLGDVWYNSNTGKLKVYGQTAAVWTSGGNAGTARYLCAGAGTQTAFLAFCGYPTPTGATEEYNGSSWTAGGNYPGAPKEALGGLGTQTAGLGFGGYNPTPVQSATNEYDGSSWTVGGSLNLARRRFNGGGTQTAGVAAGGVQSAPNADTVATTEEYNGSTWTTVNSLNKSRRSHCMNGVTQTAVLCIGGSQGTAPATETEEYDGTSWTVGPSTLYNISEAKGGGTPTGFFVAGGNASGSPGVATNVYDGTSWSSSANMAVSKSAGAGGGTSSAGIVALGTPGPTNTTEEFTAAFNSIKSVTTS